MCTSQCHDVGHKGTPRNAGQVISTQIQWLNRPSHSVNDASGPNDLGQRECAVADLDGLVQRSCAGLGNREVELVLSRVRENSSGRPG